MNGFKSTRGRTPDGAPNPVDVFVGKKIRCFRERIKMSQETLGSMLGLSFQQLQKYEQGKNRVSASRLWDLSQILGVRIDDFFDGMDDEVAQQSPRSFSQTDINYVVDDPMNRSETKALIKAYQSLKNREFAKEFLNLMISLAQGNQGSATTSQN